MYLSKMETLFPWMKLAFVYPFPKAFCPRVGLPLLELDHFLR